MKSMTSATLALLASGKYWKAELYDLVLADATTYRWTNFDIPLKVGADTYATGMTIRRGTVTSRAGLEVQSLDLTLTPQLDNPAGVITVGGYTLSKASRYGVLDNARITMWKIFLAPAEPYLIDTTTGKNFWFGGRVNEVKTGRFSTDITVNNDLELLNVSMPRNLYQSGCVHTLYDTGCTLSKATFRKTGTVSGTPTVNGFNTSLTDPTAYFDQGVITFTGGANNGLSRGVKSYVSASGAIQLVSPLPIAPAASDPFNILPACTKTQAACTNSNPAVAPPFNNVTLHFRGYPYIPNPETIYDGGTSTRSVNTPAKQGGFGGGSAFSGTLK